ncbi:hypothetical protein BDR07DRAFT_1432131 [Suillus spraguei]|nr:hypothetical protein BDR07DRAFT_1432131 [Suillus spraguei]
MIMLPLRAKVWSLAVVLTAATLVPECAFAQSSTVTCLPSFGWMNNSLEQGPCIVASYLGSACGGSYNVGPMSPGYVYAPHGTNPCECSTIFYSMISTCSVCQDILYMNFSCNQISIGEFPLDIPAGTKVPNWAYLSVTGGGFNSTAAQSDGDLPESTATGVPSTTTVIYSTTMSASLTAISTSSHVGVIAGGVVGGITGAAVIIGLAMWFFVKRRRSSTTPLASFSNAEGHSGRTQSFYSTNDTMFPMAQQPVFMIPLIQPLSQFILTPPTQLPHLVT